MNFGNILIFGDSYSTFKFHIPEGYAYYYSNGERTETDVRKVQETWWHQLISETDSKLILNNSWSGSTICHTGYGGVDCSKTSSFIHRFDELIQNGFFKREKIDTLFIFGGTNDNWAGVPEGELKFSDWTDSELHLVLPAISFFINMACEALPHARKVFIINTELKKTVTDGIIKACEHFGIEYVKLEEIEKDSGHPTIKGMTSIKNQIIKTLE